MAFGPWLLSIADGSDQRHPAARSTTCRFILVNGAEFWLVRTSVEGKIVRVLLFELCTRHLAFGGLPVRHICLVLLCRATGGAGRRITRLIS